MNLKNIVIGLAILGLGYYYEDFEFCGYEMWDPLDFPEN